MQGPHNSKPVFCDLLGYVISCIAETVVWSVERSSQRDIFNYAAIGAISIIAVEKIEFNRGCKITGCYGYVCWLIGPFCRKREHWLTHPHIAFGMKKNDCFVQITLGRKTVFPTIKLARESLGISALSQPQL